MARIFRSLTRVEHCFTADRSGWASCAAVLKRCQVHDFRQFGKRSWSEYPTNRWGWVTSTGRCLGAGVRPKGETAPGEILVAIELPFEGSGTELRRQAVKFARRLKISAR